MADDGADQGRGRAAPEGSKGRLRDRRKPSISVLGRENDFSRHGDKVVPQALACPQNTD
jgi:hypothetical protein